MKLSEDAIKFARTHVRKFYDSDFFPKPVEFSAIWSQWGPVAQRLAELDVEEVGQAPSLLLAPKPRTGFRVVHQPYPIDTLIYTALAYMAAPQIEQRRSPAEDGTVCSYRIQVSDQAGEFFVPTRDGFSMFIDRSNDLASQYGWVLVFDIADFYNQINIHRVENTLDLCCSETPGLSKAIEEFAMNLNLRGSRGIPVGPAASIVFSEASLIDLDNFLSTYSGAKIEYVRYADDFRVFSNSRGSLKNVLHDVTKYLYAEHRLALAGGKTRLMESSRFIDEELNPPERLETEKLHSRIEDFLKKVAASYSSPQDDSESTDEDDDDPRWENASTEQRKLIVKDLLDAVLERDVLDLGLARHLLRRARRYRFRLLVPHLLENIHFFAPVFRDVALYLLQVQSEASVSRNLELYEQAIKDHPETVSIPFIRYWLSWLFGTQKAYGESEIVRNYMMHHLTPIRHQALFASKNTLTGWIKNHKSSWQSFGSWDRGGILAAAESLGGTERRIWMDNVIRVGDYLDQIVAKHVRAQ